MVIFFSNIYKYALDSGMIAKALPYLQLCDLKEQLGENECAHHCQ